MLFDGDVLTSLQDVFFQIITEISEIKIRPFIQGGSKILKGISKNYP